MSTVHWTKEQAKSFMVQYHMINTNTPLSGKEGVHEVFHRLQSIQFDPLNVVGRNPDLVLQARIDDYKESMLEECLYQDRTIIDGWDKQMSIYPAKDYPHFHLVREHKRQEVINTLQYRTSIDALELEEEILDIIQSQGAIYSSDISMGEKKKLYWGHIKPSSATLEYLFHIGTLGVRERRNTQKKYDLMERLIGDIVYEKSPYQDPINFPSWYFIRRVKSMGLVWNKSSYLWLGPHIQKKTQRTKIIKDLLHKNILTEIVIEGLKQPCYTLTSILEQPKNDIIDKASFIAPLDSLIWDRELINALFDFDYKWEVYTPKTKRKYGYYVLPVLYKSDFIGRIEFAQQRRNEPLEIISFYKERNLSLSREMRNIVKEAVHRFKRYRGSTKVIGITKIK